PLYCSLSLVLRLPRSTLFPYTTLFRSNTIYGLPSIDFLQDMNSQKLQPLIEAWQRATGKRVIFPTISRSGAGSTIYEKRFAGGSDRKSTRVNSSHVKISYAVFCLKKKT